MSHSAVRIYLTRKEPLDPLAGMNRTLLNSLADRPGGTLPNPASTTLNDPRTPPMEDARPAAADVRLDFHPPNRRHLLIDIAPAIGVECAKETVKKTPAAKAAGVG
ncbi:hypothetical protein [Dyella sp. ASV21]|uniref:hypothetical protein n=1 Tax=Dyella sp. ASV21 TaxID=2795114 RepID=UPI0018ED1EC7|nr:hypothetical protein [Dyella sp. ASV21]